jgi:hypothetical protein
MNEHFFSDDVQRSGFDSEHEAARHVSEILHASESAPAEVDASADPHAD